MVCQKLWQKGKRLITIKFLDNTDIFNIKTQAFAHGVNAKGLTGGLAKEFENRFPKSIEEYRLKLQTSEITGGDIIIAFENSYWIYNLVIQIEPGANSKLEFIEMSLKKMIIHAKSNAINVINLPKLGCGIGGLQWREVKEIYDSVLKPEKSITFNVCSLA